MEGQRSAREAEPGELIHDLDAPFLERLRLDDVDLYLIHQPLGDYYSFWRAMEQIHANGLARAIGVANFYRDRLVELIAHNDVTPAIDQIGTSPFFQRHADQELMRSHGV